MGRIHSSGATVEENTESYSSRAECTICRCKIPIFAYLPPAESACSVSYRFGIRRWHIRLSLSALKRRSQQRRKSSASNVPRVVQICRKQKCCSCTNRRGCSCNCRLQPCTCTGRGTGCCGSTTQWFAGGIPVQKPFRVYKDVFELFEAMGFRFTRAEKRRVEKLSKVLAKELKYRKEHIKKQSTQR